MALLVLLSLPFIPSEAFHGSQTTERPLPFPLLTVEIRMPLLSQEQSGTASPFAFLHERQSEHDPEIVRVSRNLQCVGGMLCSHGGHAQTAGKSSRDGKRITILSTPTGV